MASSYWFILHFFAQNYDETFFRCLSSFATDVIAKIVFADEENLQEKTSNMYTEILENMASAQFAKTTISTFRVEKVDSFSGGLRNLRQIIRCRVGINYNHITVKVYRNFALL